MSATVKKNETTSRYEIFVDGELAGFEDYTLSPGVIAFNHTEVLPQFAGKGVAQQLAREILEDARGSGLKVLPYCPFVAKFIAKNLGSYLDLVPMEKRSVFGLPQNIQ